jgi:hypothetical protein
VNAAGIAKLRKICNTSVESGSGAEVYFSTGLGCGVFAARICKRG